MSFSASESVNQDAARNPHQGHQESAGALVKCGLVVTENHRMFSGRNGHGHE
jgi:hypothetical protein